MKHVSDFTYHGYWIATTLRDFRIRKAKAWAACHIKLKKMRKSYLRRSLPGDAWLSLRFSLPEVPRQYY